MTFMARDVRANVHKKKDIEEIRKMAYERLMRDIPFVLEAMKGGEFKLDTHANNVAGRLGMIAYSIVLLKIPEFPDLLYYERFIQTLEEAVVEHLIDVNVIYDGYGDFKCLGELMERFKKDETPTLVHMRNDVYAAGMKEEMYSMFRPPDKFKINITFTNVDMNRVYGNMLNDICDAYLFIWKCSGMELQHASYAAPPGTLLTRLRRGSVGQSAGVLAKPIVPTGQPFATSIQRPADSSWTPPRNTYAPQQQP
jgi:hypothetical protein